MLGSDRFAFETPNVIDPGDLPPSQPGRKQPAAATTEPPSSASNNNATIERPNQGHQNQTQDYVYNPQSTQRLLTPVVSNLQVPPTTASLSSSNPFKSYHDDRDVENQESRSFLNNDSEEKKSNLEPSLKFPYHDNPSNTRTSRDGSLRFASDPNKHAFNERRNKTGSVNFSSHLRTGGSGDSADQHSLPSIEEARTYAASLLHSANKTNARGSSSQDPFAFSSVSPADHRNEVGQHRSIMASSSAPVMDASTRRHIHESIDRNKNNSKHLVRRQLCAMCAKFLVYVLLFVVIGLIVAVAIKVTNNKKADSPQVQVISPHNDTVPTRDGDPPMSRLEKTYLFVHTSLLTSSDDLMTPNSAQYMAANWISEMDGLQLDIPETISSPEAIPFIQRYVLATLYFATNGPKSWRDKYGFLTEQHECYWHGDMKSVPSFGKTEKLYNVGVDCNTDLQVNAILMPSNEMQGSLPSEIGHLVYLRMLSVPHNQLNGNLPDSLVNLVNLEYLDVKFNFFQDRIPNVFKTHTKLQVLGLSNNYFEHQLPSSFSSLTNLKTLALDDNLLTGELSATVNSMIQLEYLYADRNGFSETVDANFLSGLTKLQELDLSANRFTCSASAILPATLLQHPTLSILDFADNKLGCSLPDALSTNNVLRFLSLRDNELSGSVGSTNLPMLKDVEHLDIQGNLFQGTWSSDLKQLTKLTYLFLGKNPNILSHAVPTWLYEMTELRELSLTSTQLTGELPEWIDHMTELEFIDFSHNNLQGNLITEIFNLPNLEYLFLHNNTGIVGAVPSNITEGEKLKMLTLFDTGIEGEVNHICVEAPSIELLAVDCKEKVICEPLCCPKCCNRQASAGVNAFCFEEAIPTSLQYFEGLWELNFTKAEGAFDPALITDKPGNPERPTQNAQSPTPAPVSNR